MNAEKLKKMVTSVRIGGKGTARRKKKTVHRANNAADDKKLQATLKKLNCHTLPGVDEANMLMEDGTLLHIEAPKEVQFGMASNVTVIKGDVPCQTWLNLSKVIKLSFLYGILGVALGQSNVCVP
jgi:nascent polypeptide-associated complex subunit beta